MRIAYNWKNLLIGMLALAFLCGEAISNENIRIAGVVLTGYRVFIILITIICVFILIKRKLYVNYLYFFFMSFVFFWIIHSLNQVFIKNNLIFINGLKAIVSLILGFLSIFCTNTLVNDHKTKEILISYMTIIFYMLILFGLIEIITGYHLPTSRLNDLQSLIKENELWGINIEKKFYIATGSCYNENDFSSLVAMMIPISFINSKTHLQKLIAIFMDFGGIIIILTNESLIPAMALLSGLFFYLFLKSNKLFKFFFTLLFIGFLTYILNSGILQIILDSSSFARRTVMYTESFKLALNLGVDSLGPSGFQYYFLQHPNNSLVSDPHNLLFELWIQYGFITLLTFILSYILIFNSIFKNFTKENKNDTLLILVLLFMYWIISFSSSSFLDKSLAFWPIGLAFLYTERTEVFLKKRTYAYKNKFKCN